MARDSSGRFIPKSGAPINPDSPPPNAVVIIKRRKDAATRSGVQITTEGLAIAFDPEYIVDAMSRGLLIHLRDSIIAGERPDGEGEQRGLGPRAATAERISDVRNVKTGELVDGLRRTPILREGNTASCMIYPPLSRQAHVAKEARRGVVLITGAGAAGKAAQEAGRRSIAEMMKGRELVSDNTEVEAKDASK